MIRVKFLLLGFAVGLSAVEKFQNSSNERFENETVTFDIDRVTATESKAQRGNETVSERSKTWTSQQNLGNMSKKSITEVLREINTCRERCWKMRNGTFAVGLRGGWIRRIRAGLGKNSNISVFHCNISKELVDGLKDKLHKLEIFQGMIVLYPKTNSLNADRFSGFGAGAEAKIDRRENNKNVRERTGRDALLGSEQIESDTKMSQISHIYLGRSRYPFLTEESRIIDRGRTLPPPVYTGPTYSDDDDEM